jgi:hypothetical protein
MRLPHLEELHIAFEMRGSHRAITWQFELVVGVLGLVVLPAGVTVQLERSLMDGYWDFQLPK